MTFHSVNLFKNSKAKIHFKRKGLVSSCLHFDVCINYFERFYCCECWSYIDKWDEWWFAKGKWDRVNDRSQFTYVKRVRHQCVIVVMHTRAYCAGSRRRYFLSTQNCLKTSLARFFCAIADYASEKCCQSFANAKKGCVWMCPLHINPCPMGQLPCAI